MATGVKMRKRRRLFCTGLLVFQCIILYIIGVKYFGKRYTIVQLSSPLFHVGEYYNNVGHGKLFIFSVVANSYVQDRDISQVIVNGWETGAKSNYTCCLLLENGTTYMGAARGTRYYKIVETDISAIQIVCDWPVAESRDKLRGVGITLGTKCDVTTTFNRPSFVDKKVGSDVPTFLMIGKAIYKGKKASEVIEWIEYNRHFGADKIILYHHEDLNEEATRVVKYYMNDPIFETIRVYTSPLQDKFPRYLGTYDEPATWQDEQVVNFDAQERIYPYTYFGLIDTDEFIMPVLKSSFVDMMAENLDRRPEMAHFVMFTEMYIKTWPVTNTSTDMMIERYSWHTNAFSDNVKCLYVTKGIVPGTIWIHTGNVKNKFTDGVAFGVVLKHFRKCRREWLAVLPGQTQRICDQFSRRRDNMMSQVAKEIRPRVQVVKQELGVT